MKVVNSPASGCSLHPWLLESRVRSVRPSWQPEAIRFYNRILNTHLSKLWKKSRSIKDLRQTLHGITCYLKQYSLIPTRFYHTVLNYEMV